LGCLHGRKGYTFGGVRTHSTKLLEVRPKTRKIIMNCIVLHRRRTNIMDLQAIDLSSNKKNLLFAFDPKRKRSTPQLNRVPSIIRKGMWMNEAL
jgi:hypothetical protein